MSNNGKAGEALFCERMRALGYGVASVADDSSYFDKDIDFIVTSPKTGDKKTFEVKWDTRIDTTGNLYLEITNKNS